jgi:hypothetical protein
MYNTDTGVCSQESERNQRRGMRMGEEKVDKSQVNSRHVDKMYRRREDDER